MNDNLTGFFDELDNIEKEAISFKALALGTGLMAAGIGGGAKAMAPKVIKSGLSRTPSIARVIKQAPGNALRVGGRSNQMRLREMSGVMPR